LRHNEIMKNKYTVLCLIILVLLAMLILRVPFTEAVGRFALLEIKGTVNLNEVGGRELKVVSLWADNPKAAVSVLGEFCTEISNQRPQKISVIDDKKKVRALAIAIPGHYERVVFDARSTAMAVLLEDSSAFGSSENILTLSKTMDKTGSFQELVAYLKKYLPQKSLEALLYVDEYIMLIENCERDIFGQNQQKIRNSLQIAEQKLEKVMR